MSEITVFRVLSRTPSPRIEDSYRRRLFSIQELLFEYCLVILVVAIFLLITILVKQINKYPELGNIWLWLESLVPGPWTVVYPAIKLSVHWEDATRIKLSLSQSAAQQRHGTLSCSYYRYQHWAFTQGYFSDGYVVRREFRIFESTASKRSCSVRNVM